MITGYAATLAALTHPEVACIDLQGPSNLFVIGPTGVGKSTFCRMFQAANAFRCGPHVQASGWIRARFPEAAALPDAERAAFLAARSLEILATEPDACVAWVRARLNDGGGALIDGLRNPQDFHQLFRPEHDYVVVVERTGYTPCTAFETGVAAIRAYAEWCEANLGARRMATWNDIVCTVSLEEVL